MLTKYSGKYVKIYFNMKITFHLSLVAVSDLKTWASSARGTGMWGTYPPPLFIWGGGQHINFTPPPTIFLQVLYNRCWK